MRINKPKIPVANISNKLWSGREGNTGTQQHIGVCTCVIGEWDFTGVNMCDD